MQANISPQNVLTAMNPELQDLMNLKQRARRDRRIRLHLSAEQDTADNADEDLGQMWYKKMIKIMGAIDDHVKYCVPFPKPGRTFCFLDLGCCPGGFSTYVLKKNKLCTGVGVSLPPEAGGHPFLIPSELMTRYNVIFHDINRFQLAPIFSAFPPLLQPSSSLPVELTVREYDLILLDGHQLRNQVDAGGLLAVSQIVVALSTTKREGSTIVMKLSNAESYYTMRILFMLDLLGSSLVAFKPFQMHRKKATFYAVARGVGGGIERHAHLQVLLERFKELWVNLLFRPRHMIVNHDLDFIASNEDLVAFSPRLNELCKDVWARQKEAMVGLFENLGVDVS